MYRRAFRLTRDRAWGIEFLTGAPLISSIEIASGGCAEPSQPIIMVDNELQVVIVKNIARCRPWPRSRDYADCPSRRLARWGQMGDGEEEGENNYRFIHRSLRDVLSDCALRPFLTNVRRAGRYPGSELRCIDWLTTVAKPPQPRRE